MTSRTLVATFKDYSTAQKAARELENLGVSSDAIQMNSTQQTATAGSTSYQNAAQTETGFAGWWNSLFGSDHEEDERRDYEGAIASGSTVLSATVPSQSVDSAVAILNQYGTVDGTSRGTADTSTTKKASTGNAPIQVVDEELQVGKRSVQRGGVRVYSRLVSTPVEEQVRLSEERVSVERRPVNREISPADISAMRDQTIEVTEMAEEAVIGKRARVREEIVVGKQATERTETVRDTVRHTEVEVEQLGTKTQATGQDYTADYRTNFAKTYGAGSSFDTMKPAYEYGYTSAGDARYKGKSWSDVETSLRSDYEGRNPGSTWEQAKSAVRYGWEKVSGQR